MSTWRLSVVLADAQHPIRIVSPAGADPIVVEGEGPRPTLVDVGSGGGPVDEPDEDLAPRPGEDLSPHVYPPITITYPMEQTDRTYRITETVPGKMYYAMLPQGGNPGGYLDAGIIAPGATTVYGKQVGEMRLWVPEHPVETTNDAGTASVTVDPPEGYQVRRMLRTGRLG